MTGARFRLPILVALALYPVLLFAGEVVATTDRFELRSNPRVNLHHFLIAWAAADDDAWPSYALPVAERDYWLALLEGENRQTWQASVDAYAAVNGRSVVSDAGLIALRDWAAGAAPRDAIPQGDRAARLPLLEEHWRPILESAAPHAAERDAALQALAGRLQ